MAAYFDGSIHSLPQETVTDLNTVLAYLETHSVPKHVAEASANLLAYVDNYQIHDERV